MRLVYLFLRSRLAGWALLALAVSAGVTWLLLQQITTVGHELKLVLVVLPLIPAVVIGTSTRSPFGDLELVASRWIRTLRAGHLAGLVLCGAVGLGLVGHGWSVTHVGWELARNVLGYTGLALLGARVLGGSVSWVVPLTYATLVLMLDPDSRWAWPRHVPFDGWSVMIALALGTIGWIAVIPSGAREEPGEN